jgi:hypothetical protein
MDDGTDTPQVSDSKHPSQNRLERNRTLYRFPRVRSRYICELDRDGCMRGALLARAHIIELFAPTLLISTFKAVAYTPADT